MTKYIPIAGKCLLLLFVTLASCTKRFSEVSVYSNLQEGDSISVALHSIAENRYHTVNSVSVTAADVVRNRIDVPLPDSLLRNISAMSFTVHRCSDSILAVSAIRLNGLITISPQNIMNSLWWQDGLAFVFDPESDVIKSPVISGAPVSFPVPVVAFQHLSRPIGFQLFLRLSLCAVLLFLIAFLYRQSTMQRILLISVAFFIACFPLKMEWSNWTLGVMGLVSLIGFLISKERKFRWQTIFWIPTVTYVLYWIGILYAMNKIDAYKELDSSVAFLIFPIIFSMIQWKRENINLLLRFFIRAMTVFCIFGIVSYATIVPEFTWNMAFGDSKLYAPLLLMWPAFPHPSVTAMVLAMAVPVAIYLRYRAKNISMVEMLFCLCLIMIFSMLTGARVAMIVVPLLIGLGFWIYGKIRPVFKWILTGTVIAGCILTFYRYPELQTRFSDPIREQLRATAMDAFSQKPAFGWGTGSMKQIIASEETAHRLGYDAPFDMNHFHNQYLDMAVQLGIPGILLMLGLLGGCLYLALKYKDFLFLSFFVIYLIFMLVESPFATIKGIQPLMFWFCFLAATQKTRMDSL